MQADQVIKMGKGEQIRCLRSGRDGGRFEFELELGPRTSGPPPHRHAEGPEEIEVLEGEIEFTVAGHIHRLAPGDRLEIPAGVAHTFRNPSKKQTARAVCGNGSRFERAVDQHAGGGPAFTRLARYLTEVDPDASYMTQAPVRGVLRLVSLLGRLRRIEPYLQVDEPVGLTPLRDQTSSTA